MTLQVKTSINRFIAWLDGFGEVSYDRMDFFASKPGIWTKRLFYKNKYLGAPFAAFALWQETLVPSMLKLYAKPRREAIGDAHFAEGFLNLYQATGEKQYLERGEHFLEALRQSAIKDTPVLAGATPLPGKPPMVTGLPGFR